MLTYFLHIATPIDYPEEYFYGLSLVVGAVVCWLLAGMLLLDPDNYIHTSVPRYLRSRRLTAVALLVFGLGFFLHWWFMPRYNNPLAASALSLAYFHIAGVLFSMSHTGLIDRHYLTHWVVIHNVSILILSLSIYGISVLLESQALQYVGFVIFFLHIDYLTWRFYLSFHRVYLQLGVYAEYLPNDTDRNMRWLFFSCYLIILFGIGGIIVTLLFPNDTLPFIILMFIGNVVFAYIYKSLDGFSSLAYEAEMTMEQCEAYLQTPEGRKEMQRYITKRNRRSLLSTIPMLSGFIKQW